MEIHSECQELKNIKYKSMLKSGVSLKETNSSDNLSNLEKFLENEKNVNINDSWCKLNKTIKIKKLFDYSDLYQTKNNIDNDEKTKLISFLKDCLDKKKLQRVKDVIYDNKHGIIKDIPAILYNKQLKHFTLKNIDKRVSTLKSLAPKKTQGTIKHKPSSKTENNNSDIDEDET
jgi:hypothetical protein